MKIIHVSKSKDIERIPGGKARNKDHTKYDKTQLSKGISVEQEHVEKSKLPKKIKDEVAQEIAKDHLEESKDKKGRKGGKYYDKLELLEKEIKKEIGETKKESKGDNMRIIESAKKKKKSKEWNPNPWAVCHTTVDKKKDPDKYERCVKDVKKKQKKEAQTVPGVNASYCPHCNAPLDDANASKCSKCGYELVNEDPIRESRPVNQKSQASCGFSAKTAQSFDMGEVNNSGLENGNLSNDLSGVDNEIDPAFGMGIDLVGIYTKEGYLSYVVTLEEYKKAGSSFWVDYLGDEYDPSSMKILMLKDVSDEDASVLLTQGTARQSLDGYEAANVASPYVEGNMLSSEANSYFDITKIAQGDDELEDSDIGEDEPSTGKNVDDYYAKGEPDNKDKKNNLPPWLKNKDKKTAQSNIDSAMNKKRELGPDDYSYFFKNNEDYSAYIKLVNKDPRRAEEMMVQLIMSGRVTKKHKMSRSKSYFDITKIAQYDGDWGDFDSDQDFSSPEPDDLQEFSDRQAWEDSQGEMTDDFIDEEENEEAYYTIEPDRGGQGFVAKMHDTYPENSVLSGRPRDISLDFADTVEELMDKYPGAEVLDHTTSPRTTYEDAMNMQRPDDFDEMDAGEQWEQEPEPRNDWENETPFGQQLGDGFDDGQE